VPIPFNKSRAAEFAAQPKIAEGYHALVVIDVQPHQGRPKNGVENHNILAKVTLQKILDPEDGDTRKGPTVKVFPTLPLDNPEVEGHEVPQWAGRMFAEFAASVNEALPEPPRFDRDTKETFYRGEAVEKGPDVERARIDCIQEAGAWASEWWGEEGDNLQSIVGQVVYGSISYPEGSEWPDVGRLSRECAEDAVITDEIEKPIEVLDPSPKKKTAKKKTKKRK
jgi:hypothetical protein